MAGPGWQAFHLNVVTLRRSEATVYLVLPGDGNTARVEFGVEVVVDVVQGDSPHHGKLLQVSDVIAIHQPGLFFPTHTVKQIGTNSKATEINKC